MGRKAEPLGRMTEGQSALAAKYYPMACAIGKRWAKRFPRHKAEVFSAAFFRLAVCARKWDAARNVAFVTYAAPLIRLAIIDAINGESRATSPEFYQNNGRVFWTPPNDRSAGPDESDAFEALIRPLPQRNREVMRLIYAEGLTQREAAAKCGRWAQQVNQIHAESLAILRGRLAPAA